MQKICIYLAILFTSINVGFTQKANKQPVEKYQKNNMLTQQKWYKGMKDGANYFAIKKQFDQYFAQHPNVHGRPRTTGERWLREKLFYINKKGIVQPVPPIPDSFIASNSRMAKLASTTTRQVGTWSIIGPVNTSRTGMSGGDNHGGYVSLNRIDPYNTNRMFVSFLVGGLWVTLDGGKVWTLADANMSNDRYWDIDICKDSSHIVYAISNSAVIKSTDGGLSWTKTNLNTVQNNSAACDIAVSPTNPNIVVARWGNQLLRTTNGGVSWTSVLNNLSNFYHWDGGVSSEYVEWHATDTNKVFHVSILNNTQAIIYASSDKGASFSTSKTITIAPTAKGQVIGWGKILTSTNNTNSIYLLLGTGTSQYGHTAAQYYKLDAATLNILDTKINFVKGDGNGYDNLSFSHHGDVCIDRHNDQKWAILSYGNTKLLTSTDGGVTLKKSNSNTHYDLRSADWVNNNILVGTDGESELSTDNGTTVNTCTNSIGNHELWGMGCAYKSDMVGVGCNHGPLMLKQTYGGFEWFNGPGADQGYTSVNPLDDRYSYSTGYSNYLMFAPGNHQISYAYSSNQLDVGGGGAAASNIEFHPNLYYTIFSHHGGQYGGDANQKALWQKSFLRSDDNGRTVNIIKTFNASPFRYKVALSDANTMYVVEGNSNNKLWKTTDGGVTWINITPTLAASSYQTQISDIAVSDVDANVLWISYGGRQINCKILKSVNGGISWTNLTTNKLTLNPVTKMVYQRGTQGGIYLATRIGVFYRNNNMTNWEAVGNGLPIMEINFMFVNNNLNKLRIGGTRGAWEHDLYEVSKPVAQIAADKNTVTCGERVQFKDYSTVHSATSTFSWSFPGATPATSNLENPIVHYRNASAGKYSVTLTVTDTNGTSTTTLKDFITVLPGGNCKVDTVPGNSLTLNGTTDYATQTGNLGIQTNTLTISAWIKPSGVQTNDAGIVMSGSGGATGIKFNGGKLGYHWNDMSSTWGLQGPTIPLNTWSHVAMVQTPTRVSLYVNGVAGNFNGNYPAISFTSPFMIGSDRAMDNRFFKGEIDEVAIYNKALTPQEIRALMYLTKNNPNAGSMPAEDENLVAYYQFNEAGTICTDKALGNNLNFVATANTASKSTAPVGGGTAEIKAITAAGVYNFAKPLVELNFPTAGTYPNGDVVVTRINVKPDTLPALQILPSTPRSYYIINSYGSSNFTALPAVKFNNVFGITDSLVATPSFAKLYKRTASFGASWLQVDEADTVTHTNNNGSVLFNTGSTTGHYAVGVIGTGVIVPNSVVFLASKLAKQALLQLTITNKVNAVNFELQKSINGKDFVTIKTFDVTAVSQYSMLDEMPAEGYNFYRVKINLQNGKYAYSDTKVLNFGTTDKGKLISIMPNPTTDGYVLLKVNEHTPKALVQVYSSAGTLVRETTLQNIVAAQPQRIFIGNQKGTYIIKTILANGTTSNEKIVVQ